MLDHTEDRADLEKPVNTTTAQRNWPHSSASLLMFSASRDRDARVACW